MANISIKALSKLVELSPGRYREDHGLNFDEFSVGDTYEHRPGRTITDADNTWMSLICMNTHPLHINSDYAKGTEFGALLVSSLVTFSIVGGMSLASTSNKGIANLGWDKVRLLAPVFVGDTIYAESEVIAKRRSESRPGQGVVTVRTKGVKASGEVFLSYERSFLIELS
ncbi:MaoC family dehydratase [Pseudomonas sp. R11-23-07]|uniref:MaoC family dehydratase n=1 Tax=Pseudomonas sp. R11-23-07 TaxID=658632 RepID=UPI000F576489|nr:MaoC family dehydratase [Pseudomonas sp. R11-23-07]AZF58238.1 Acyl dehydratase [Pseudomonas sp. R11-23-07]